MTVEFKKLMNAKAGGPLENLTEALEFFLAKVGGRFVRAEQGAKGPMCFILVDTNHMRVYLFFKRDWLHSYGHLFPDEEWKGWGQTVNYGLLKKAKSEGAIITIVTPDSAIYTCLAEDWLKYAEEHHTIRRPTEEIGLEASVPANKVKRVIFET